MNQKQLANVLIKVIGVLICAQNVGGIIAALFTVIQAASDRAHGYMPNVSASWIFPLSHLIELAVGGWLIAQSRWLADKLFTSADE